MDLPQPLESPYGFWKSPITADAIVAETINIQEVALDGKDVYWIESRPSEKGRYVIVRRTANGEIVDITPKGFSARTLVHEYGGGAFVVKDGVIYFSNFNDQRIYRQTNIDTPQPLTPDEKKRYADGDYDVARNRIICIQEDHTNELGEPVNSIVAVAVAVADSRKLESLVQGNDFYSSPRLTHDGKQIAWLTWNHPNMPWVATELWIANCTDEGKLENSQKVAGGSTESILQPKWSPDGLLYFISDRSGYWNLYKFVNGKVEPVLLDEAEFGQPPWQFGTSTYAFVSANHIVCTYAKGGRWILGIIDLLTGLLKPIDTPFTYFTALHATPEKVVAIAGSPTMTSALVQIDLKTYEVEILRRSTQENQQWQPYFSTSEAIEFPTEKELTAHAFFYPPKNPEYIASAGSKPPLLVMCHGGPTAASDDTLNLSKQFWTSRGIAILDVNYGGSTGFGREYRDRLKGKWGIIDIDDCINAAKYLIQKNLVDSQRIAITGGSAGGYTTLSALTFRNFFKTGASFYGVSDLELLVRDTHKFESHYLEWLIGPYPDRRDLYEERSPVHHADKLSSPLIFFQGNEDRIVPPNQTEKIVEALRGKNIPVGYFLFDGEQHGFRQAENIKHALEAELYFFDLWLTKSGLRF
ncbi:prolyl oligopeptidase family serine peptidase [Nostoc sp. UIC 10630]|uniref:S9 family peptidase n=1 Tax=Nostoc sp. UIC 10630 TaxID=2100146 RepID=UPI0013D46BAA|nr:prolyl oligopeptidase family serine peptidase [Nostoc sp. UIC 10630]NEU80209.1 S9 family peptidase [Nostoc sp. UIC 10630]